MIKLLRVGLALVLAVTIPTLSLAYQGESDKKNSKQSKGALPPYNGPKKRLAIVDIEVKSTAASDTGANANAATTNGVGTGSATATASASGDLGSGLTEMLATSLVDSKRFILLERKAMADITAEQQLSTGAGFDPTAANKPGQLLGAQFLIRGAVDEFGSSHSNNAANGVLQNFGINQESRDFH